jgi:hypothetical protein
MERGRHPGFGRKSSIEFLSQPKSKIPHGAAGRALALAGPER